MEEHRTVADHLARPVQGPTWGASCHDAHPGQANLRDRLNKLLKNWHGHKVDRPRDAPESLLASITSADHAAARGENVGLEDWIPEKLRQKAVDAALRKAADVADQAGLPDGVSEILRSLRTDIPFLEDMAQALGRATELMTRDSSVRSEVADFLAHECKTNERTILEHLEALLFTVAETNQAALQDFVLALESSCPKTIERAELAHAVSVWAHLLRQQLWAHPKLIGVNDLLMQYTQALATQRLTDQMSGLTGELSALRHTVRDLGTKLPAGAVAPALTLGPSAPSTTVGPHASTVHPQLPDILTPNLTGIDTLRSYAPIVGEEAASWLAGVQERVIQSIETAQFEQQDKIADEILAANMGLPELTVTGHYLQGEARRLMSDMARDPQTKGRLQAEAITSYETALELAPGETRALRGLARTLEVQGDIGKALTLFEDARIRALSAFRDGAGQSQNGVIHEVLRSTRHYAACIVDAIDQNPRSEWSKELGLLQLHGLVAESDHLHRGTLDKFAGSSDWIDIEWFMGLVLLAKGYSKVGDSERAWSTLLFALMARVRMFNPDAVSRSAVELANLGWWCATALRIRHLPAQADRLVCALQDAVTSGDIFAIETAAQNLISPVVPPWGKNVLATKKGQVK